jgi:hypothetical protein
MTQEPVRGWKKWFAIGFGFGAGAGVVIVSIGGFAIWYDSRPKPWNSSDITATFSTPLYNVDDNNGVLNGEELEYIIDNKTSKDFTLTPDQSFFLQDGGALRRSFTGNYKVADKCFVPAKNKVKCEITVSSDFDTSFNIDGFAVFDDETRHSILFPKPTSPTPAERTAFLNKFKEKVAQTSPIK